MKVRILEMRKQNEETKIKIKEEIVKK